MKNAKALLPAKHMLFSLLAVLVTQIVFAGTFNVINLNDSGDGSLRFAIQQANATAGPHTINFSLGGTIVLATPLPALSQDYTIIDASSQWQGTWPDGSPGIVIDGAALTAGNSGIIVGASNCEIRGLHIKNVNKQQAGNGIFIANYKTNNVIGGTGAGMRNVITNNYRGIRIHGNDNAVIGNYIGIDASGTDAAPNIYAGIDIQESSGNTIGGNTPEERNIISGNQDAGILVFGQNNAISGNYIGTDKTGTAAIANEEAGIKLFGDNNLIGGAIAGAGNVISGNGVDGIVLQSAFCNTNLFQGNLIGTTADGISALGNAEAGIYITTSAHHNTIGGTETAARNIISGNGWGIYIDKQNTSHNTIKGNYIGLNVNGAARPNTDDGIAIFEGAGSNTIGGAETGAGNVISGNGFSGIYIGWAGDDEISGTVIRGNYIGTDPTGMLARPNAQVGILLNESSNNTEVISNLISGNTGDGISVEGGSHIIKGNIVGANKNKTAALANSVDGISLLSDGNIVGGTAEEDGNFIAYNGANGMYITKNENLVYGNTIRNNQENGIIIAGCDEPAQNNVIGGTALGQANIIHNNGESGVLVYGVDEGAGECDFRLTDYNRISGNSVYENAIKGIQLEGSGNGPGNDPSISPPVITSFEFNESAKSATLFVEGTDAGANAAVEIFIADTPASGQGKTYLGTITANASGEFSGTLDVSGSGMTDDDEIVATTTHTDENTSEFSETETGFAVSNFPWTESFENSSASRDFWSQTQEAGNKNWTFATGAGGGSITTAQSGTLNARFTSSSGGPHITKLITPVLNMSGASSALLGFWYGQQDWYGDQNELKVYYRISESDPWIQIAHYAQNVSSWTQVTSLNLPNPSSSYQIAFEGIDNFGRANVIDEVTVHIEGSCLSPVDLTVISMDDNSVSFGWTPRGMEDTWNVEMGPPGFMPGNNEELQKVYGTQNNPITLNGLSEETTYEFYVQADCGSGDVSIWAGPISYEFLGGGSTCEDPKNISLPLIDYADNTQAYGNDYSRDWVTPASSYLNGYDFVAQFTLSQPGNLSGSVAGEWTGLFILQECPDPTNPAQVLVRASGSNGGSFGNLELAAGDYYAIVSTFPSPDYTDFVLNLSFVPELTECLEPTGLNTFDITKNSAVLDWTEGSVEPSWNLKYGPSGFDFETQGTLIEDIDKPYLLEDLEEGTSYDFYVQAICSQTLLSDWVGPHTFSTLSPPVLTANQQGSGIYLEWGSGNQSRKASSDLQNLTDRKELRTKNTTQKISLKSGAKANKIKSGNSSRPANTCETAVTAVIGLNSSPQSPYWFEFTPATDGLLTISSCIAGQSVDTDLYVYDACDGSIVAENDDWDDCIYEEYASRVSFPAQAGVSYKIFWDDYWDDDAFDFTLDFEGSYVPGPGDSCDLAVEAEVGLNTAPYAPYWFEFTPDANMYVSISSCLQGQEVDTYLSIFNECGGNVIAVNDDEADCEFYDFSAGLTFYAQEGISYKIFWDDEWDASGFDFLLETTDPCIVECPPEAIAENEACGQSSNDGCFYDPANFDPISPGDVICGTLWADWFSTLDVNFDSDWFEYETTEPTTLVWKVTAEFPFEIYILDESLGCDGASLAFTEAETCEEVMIYADVPPGKYWLVVMPHILLDYLACGGGNNYVAELTTFAPHFNVWKDDALLATTENTSLLDDDVVDGETYCYTVSEAVRPGVETGMSNQECVLFVYDEVPESRLVTGVTGSDETNCLDAQQTITVQNFTAQSGSSTNLIAGNSIVFLPETHIKSGATLHAWITESGEFCAQQPIMLASEAVPDNTQESPAMKEYPEMDLAEKPHFIIYPNPTTGIFTIEWRHPGNLVDVSVEIINMQGRVVYRRHTVEGLELEADLSAQPPGIYFVRVVIENEVLSRKLIKQ